MPLVLKMASPQHRSWCVLPLAKKESVTAVQSPFRTQFHMDILHKVWDELVYCLDICRVTRGAHIESLVRCVQNFESFSIDWCRYEVLSTPHLFSVSFWKCYVILRSPCIIIIFKITFPTSEMICLQQKSQEHMRSTRVRSVLCTIAVCTNCRMREQCTRCDIAANDMEISVFFQQKRCLVWGHCRYENMFRLLHIFSVVFICFV
jgi:hypothetical protein